MSGRILILDYGGQYVQNIARAFLEMSIPAEIVPPDIEAPETEDYAGIVLSGGPYSVYDKSAPSVRNSILQSGKPILGLCYGHQLLAHRLGGEVSGGRSGEYGFAEVEITRESPLFKDIKSPQICWMSHGDEVKKLPKGFVSLASTEDCPNAAMAHESLPLFGLQFHPEVSHTPEGWHMLRNFAEEICDLEIGSWDPQSYVSSKILQISEEVGDGRAMVAVSGGVDSTVTAVLARRALGERLVTVHVDHGFMREGESERVVEELRDLGLNPILIDASETFLRALEGVSDADQKRKIIGGLFIRTFEKVAAEREVTALVQGTIAPDTIESSRGMASKGKGSKHGGMIKLHHNVGGLPKEMWIKVVEPIRDLFKYQVRILGRSLGVPTNLLERQPFPGPGLSVRVSGAIDRRTSEVLRRATSVAEEALAPYHPSQYLVYLIGRKGKRHPQAEEITRRMLGRTLSVSARVHEDTAVGVKGDERILGRIVSLSVEKEGKPAWDAVPWLDLLRLQSAITGRIRDVCRVLAFLGDRETGDLAAVIRAVETRDFMTAMPSKIPFGSLGQLSKDILDLPLIGAAYYEITTKPSSTIELE